MPTTDLDQVRADVRSLNKALRKAGIHEKLLGAVDTRATKSGRRTTGEFTSNRDPRWKLKLADPQYGTELDCKIIYLRLWGMVLCFNNAPTIAEETRTMLESYLGSPIVPGTFRDSLTLELLDYYAFAAEAANTKKGQSAFHIGHTDPTAKPRHTAENVAWRSHRSNMVQGDLTLAQARTRIVEIIARYFELGEVTITPAKTIVTEPPSQTPEEE